MVWNFFFFSFCVLICVHACACKGQRSDFCSFLQEPSCAHRGWRSAFRSVPQEPSTMFFEARSLTGNWASLIMSPCLASHGALGMFHAYTGSTLPAELSIFPGPGLGFSSVL